MFVRNVLTPLKFIPLIINVAKKELIGVTIYQHALIIIIIFVFNLIMLMINVCCVDRVFIYQLDIVVKLVKFIWMVNVENIYKIALNI